MTNNLKAERTLTAEELQAIIDDANGEYITRSGIIFTVRQARSPDPATVIEMALELQHLRSQSLSTQQPMGEVETSFQMLMDAYVRGYSWSLENPDSQEFVHKAAYDYADKTTSALHPNQESGE